MQSMFLLCSRISSSSDSASALSFPFNRKPSAAVPHFLIFGYWAAHYDNRSRRLSDRHGPVSSAATGEQDHYAVLGLPYTASAADVKRAYRLLARKYHPDVSKDKKAGELFKSIRFAYEVLSDEVSRAKYDRKLMFPGGTEQPRRRKWSYDSEYDDWRAYRWAELRRRMQYEKQNKAYSWYDQNQNYKKTTEYERGPFVEVLRFAFLTLFFMQTLGYKASLTLCGLAALSDKELDAGYKMGYFIAWLLGGRLGILLSLCIHFASWLCGKNSSSVMALVVVAMWVGANLARFAPIPQGAVLTLLYMSIRIHTKPNQ